MGAWEIVFVILQCYMIVYLREINERRLFGLASPPVDTVERWRSASQQTAPKRLSEMLPDPVFSESFSQVHHTTIYESMENTSTTLCTSNVLISNSVIVIVT
jgi:hypothetical protein